MPRVVTGDIVKPGAIVIDVGIDPEQDAETGKVRMVAEAVSPVPGGVGPITDVLLIRLRRAIDRAPRHHHDVRVVEYASITAALAILASSLGGALGSALPATDVRAAAAVANVAAKQSVSGADARAAYAKAPFRRPVLRYLYAVGWVGSMKDRASCQAALLLGPKPKDAAEQFIRRSPKVLARLRAAHVTVSQAATAIGRGAVDGCA